MLATRQPATQARPAQGIWSRGVTVSTLDSESSDRGSNPREAFFLNALGRFLAAAVAMMSRVAKRHEQYVSKTGLCNTIFESILAEGAIALSVTLSGGALFAS